MLTPWRDGAKNLHLLRSVSISLQGDRATASSKFILCKMNGAKPEAEYAERYGNQLVRGGGAWKSKQRRALPQG